MTEGKRANFPELVREQGKGLVRAYVRTQLSGQCLEKIPEYKVTRIFDEAYRIAVISGIGIMGCLAHTIEGAGEVQAVLNNDAGSVLDKKDDWERLWP